MAPLFAIGWVTTEAAGIDVAKQFTVFGASGSVVFGVLSGLLLAAGKRTQDRDTSLMKRASGPAVRHRPWLVGALLIALPLAFNACFAGLAAKFDYPDILRRPTDEVLARFREAATASCCFGGHSR